MFSRSPSRASFSRSQLALALALPFGAFAADLEVRLLDAQTREPLADVVVSLTPIDATGKTAGPSPSTPPAEIIQRDEEFLPYVTAVRTGTPVAFPNRDTVQHHVYSLSKPKKFELPLHDPGKADTVVFDQPGVVAVGCNIHDWMLAYIVVVDTPHFAVSRSEGRVTFANLPDARYRLELWHPRIRKPITEEISLPAAAPLERALSLKPDRRIRRAPTAAGSSYR